MSKRPVFPSRDQQRRALLWWIFSASKGGRIGFWRKRGREGYLAGWLGCGHKERRAGACFELLAAESETSIGGSR